MEMCMEHQGTKATVKEHVHTEYKNSEYNIVN